MIERFSRNETRGKLSERLQAAADEARDILSLHAAGKLSLQETESLLTKLKRRDEGFFDRLLAL